MIVVAQELIGMERIIRTHLASVWVVVRRARVTIDDAGSFLSFHSPIQQYQLFRLL